MMKKLLYSSFVLLFLGLLPLTSYGRTAQTAGEPIRILSIGNSFSVDAVEQNLYELFKAEGIEVIIGNMYKGGCSLDRHYDYISNDKPGYSYRKVEDGKRTVRDKVTLASVLETEDWDYISLQQSSGSSGIYSTYSHLAYLVEYLRKEEPQAILMWHQTWAYAEDLKPEKKAEWVPVYGRNQMTMYNAIMDVSRKLMADYPDFSIMIPCGTAIQNGRTSYLGDRFCRDGYHLDLTFGRYTAACTWFEALSGRSVVGNPYAPASIDEGMKKIAQKAAHAAVRKPYELTPIRVKYKSPVPGNALSVMSFNLRRGATVKMDERDGKNRWDKRRNAVVKLINECSPDVLGIQEGLLAQVDWISEKCPQYTRVGVGRKDGGMTSKSCEFNAIYYKTDKFTLLDSGTFWLSETPAAPSRSWDAKNYRIATWVRLKNLKGKEFVYVNTHIETKACPEAQAKGMKVLMGQIAAIAGECRVMLGGDFNVEPGHEVLAPLAYGWQEARKASPVSDDKDSYNAFGKRGQQYDHIFFKGFKPLSFKTVDANYGVPYVSDHYPVMAILRF